MPGLVGPSSSPDPSPSAGGPRSHTGRTGLTGFDLAATEGSVNPAKGAKIETWVIAQPVTPYHSVVRRQAAGTLAALHGNRVAVSEVGAISHRALPVQ